MPQREGGQRRRARLGREAEPAAETAEETRPQGSSVWSGSISFGLVTVPVELYSAQRRGGVPLRMLAPDGTPLARQYVCPAENEPVERDELVRGYEVAEGEFVRVEAEELEALAPRRSRDIELVRFVDRTAIDPSYFVRAYFLVPGGEQTKAYRLLAETMEKTGRAAIATFVMRDKAYAVAIFADAGILRAETLRFEDELRSADTIGLPAPVAANPERVRTLREAIEALAEDRVEEAELRDDAAERLLGLARQKRERGEDVVERPAGAETEAAASEEAGQVVDLMALLKQRIGTPEGARRPKRAAADKPVAAEKRAGAEKATAAEKPAARRRKGPKRAGERGSPEGDSRQELLEQARKLKIAGRTKMSRAELARAIRRAG